MADIHRGWEGAAQEGADHRPQAIGEQDVAQVVAVAGSRGAFDVVHPLCEVVDAKRNRGRQQRCGIRQAGDHLRAEDGQVDPELLEGIAHLRGVEACPPEDRIRGPAHGGADHDGRQSAGDPERQADACGPGQQDD